MTKAWGLSLSDFTVLTRGQPSVNTPSLSKITVLVFPAASKAVELLYSTPFAAIKPMPTMSASGSDDTSDIGVATIKRISALWMDTV